MTEEKIRCVTTAFLYAATTPTLLGRTVRRTVDPVVLLHLLSGGAGPIFRSQSAFVAYIDRIGRDYRSGVAHQHNAVGKPAGNARNVADLPFVFYAVLRVELRSAGEGSRVLPDLFAPAG